MSVVDVLAMLDPNIRDPHSGEVIGHDADIAEARAAVAALLADGWNMVATARHTGEPIDPERLAAALERVGVVRSRENATRTTAGSR